MAESDASYFTGASKESFDILKWKVSVFVRKESVPGRRLVSFKRESLFKGLMVVSAVEIVKGLRKCTAGIPPAAKDHVNMVDKAAVSKPW